MNNAKHHGRNAETEASSILEESVKVESRIKLGSVLAEIGHHTKLTDKELTAIEQMRDKAPDKPISFE